jgi:hypothetical protein
LLDSVGGNKQIEFSRKAPISNGWKLSRQVSDQHAAFPDWWTWTQRG